MKLHDRLPDALDRIANSIVVDDPGPFDPTAVPVLPELAASRRPLVAATAAAAVVAVGLGAIGYAAARPSASSSAPATTAVPPTAAPLGPAGALTPPVWSALTIDQATADALSGDGSPIRWYATADAAPESATWLRLASHVNAVPATQRLGCPLDDARTVELPSGDPACIVERTDGEPIGRIAVDRSPYSVVIEGRATDDELVTAASRLAASGSGGFEVTADGLPAGVSATGSGWGVSDFAATGVAAGTAAVLMGWSDPGGRLLFYVATPDEATFLPNLRLGYDTVTDATVRGGPGFVRTIAAQPAYLGVVWMQDGLLYQLGSQGYTQTELLQLIDQLQPATDVEWQAATDDARTIRDDAGTATTVTVPG